MSAAKPGDVDDLWRRTRISRNSPLGLPKARPEGSIRATRWNNLRRTRNRHRGRSSWRFSEQSSQPSGAPGPARSAGTTLGGQQWAIPTDPFERAPQSCTQALRRLHYPPMLGLATEPSPKVIIPDAVIPEACIFLLGTNLPKLSPTGRPWRCVRAMGTRVVIFPIGLAKDVVCISLPRLGSPNATMAMQSPTDRHPTRR